MKISNFLFAGLLLLLASCGEEGISPNPEAQIVGTWTAQSFTASMEATSEFAGTSVNISMDMEGQDMDYLLTFTETDYSAAGTYGIKGSVDAGGGSLIPLDQTYTEVTGDGTYSLNGDEITSNGAFFDFTVEGFDMSMLQGEVKATIEKLTDKELIFVQETEETTSQEVGGEISISTSKIMARSVWKRQ